jgi:polysaccharide export outer membrane protein
MYWLFLNLINQYPSVMSSCDRSGEALRMPMTTLSFPEPETRSIMKNLNRFMLFLLITGSPYSCLSYREMVNFQDGAALGRDGGEIIPPIPPLTVQRDDQLQVTINSYNQEEALRFNIVSNQSQVQLSAQGSNTATLADPLGYRVDSRGQIELPVIGRITVAGHTLEQIRDSVNARVTATGYLKDLSVQVRFLSFRVTILGEVNSPGTYTIPSQKINVLEALGMARDVTMFSRRDNILVVREEEGKRLYGRINLKSKDLFSSQYYYLKPNDILYVEPHKSKVLSAPDPASRYLGIVLGIATLATLIATL